MTNPTTTRTVKSLGASEHAVYENGELVATFCFNRGSHRGRITRSGRINRADGSVFLHSAQHHFGWAYFADMKRDMIVRGPFDYAVMPKAGS